MSHVAPDIPSLPNRSRANSLPKVDYGMVSGTAPETEKTAPPRRRPISVLRQR